MPVRAVPLRSAADLEVINEGLRDRINELEREVQVLRTQTISLPELQRELEETKSALTMINNLRHDYQLRVQQLEFEKEQIALNNEYLLKRLEQVSKRGTGPLRMTE